MLRENRCTKVKKKRKLEAAKDNPEEYARVLEEIEKRKERNNKMALFLVGLFLLILFFSVKSSPRHVIHLLDYVPMAKNNRKKSDTIPDSKTSHRIISPSERQALMSRKCSVPGCNTGNFRMTDYCHKHQDYISSNKEPETEEEENWWGDGN